MAGSHSRRIQNHPLNRNTEGGPTPERRSRGIVELVERPIADESGRPSRPYRAVDTLAVMERRGSITGGMRQAGEDFRARFAVAQLDPLRAPDLSRPRERGASRFKADEPGMRIEGAREAVGAPVVNRPSRQSAAQYRGSFRGEARRRSAPAIAEDRALVVHQ